MEEEMSKNQNFERLELVVNTMNKIVYQLDGIEDKLSILSNDLNEALDILDNQ